MTDRPGIQHRQLIAGTASIATAMLVAGTTGFHCPPLFTPLQVKETFQ